MSGEMMPLTPEQLATTPAGPPPPGVVPNLINPETIDPAGIVIIGVFQGLAVVTVFVRMYTRLFIVKKPWWDDWTMLIAIVCSCGLNGFSIAALNDGGLGTHIWDTPIKYLVTADYSKRLLGAQLLYPVTDFFVKLSILLLVLRIFARNLNKVLSYFIYGGMAILTIFTIVIFVLVGYYCIPRPSDHGIAPASCNAADIDIIIVLAVFNMCIDIYIFAVPLTVVRKLQVSTSKKIGIAGVFATGLLACLASVITLYYRVVFLRSTDPIWDVVPSIITGSLEVNIGIIAGCLPCLPALWTSLRGKGAWSLRDFMSRLFSAQQSSLNDHLELSDTAETAPGKKTKKKNSIWMPSITDVENGMYDVNERRGIVKTISVQQERALTSESMSSRSHSH